MFETPPADSSDMLQAYTLPQATAGADQSQLLTSWASLGHDVYMHDHIVNACAAQDYISTVPVVLDKLVPYSNALCLGPIE